MTIVPSRVGRALDVPATLESLSAALLSRSDRVATATVRVAQPDRTTREAKAMGITDVVSSYTTSYGGTEGRVHNVQLVADLIDGALVAPGATFSFNGTTGERNAEKGFEEAPVIINGELQNGIGGGVCQVSTTVFNAVFEAGLSIEQRNNHALYIDHYPLGRDATVNYPDLDLKFSNDTDHWLLVRTFVGAGSLTVNLYGTPTGRRVESETAPLTVTGEMPVEAIDDASLDKGTKVVEEAGAPPRETSVRRIVYKPDGSVLYEHHLDVALRLRARDRPRRHQGGSPAQAGEGEEEGATGGRRARPRCRDAACGRHRRRRSAIAIASTSRPGTRVGTRVRASTVAWVV